MVVGSPAQAGNVYGLLVSLASEAQGLSPAALGQRLADVVAWHYGATACSLHRDATGWPQASSDPRGTLSRLPALERARVETIDARLARQCMASNAPVSALDLDAELRTDSFLSDTLGVSDVFAIPLRRQGRVEGALVLYLPLASRSLGDADLEALSGTGEILGARAVAAPARANGLANGQPDAPAVQGPLGFLKRLFS